MSRQRLPGLERLRSRLEHSDDLLLTASNVIRGVVRAQIQRTFVEHRDPIGRAWAPRKHSYPWPLLQKTGAMRRGWYVRKQGLSTVFGNSMPYTRFHQDGTSRMDARKMVPDQRLSPRWRAEIDRVLPRALRQYFRTGLVQHPQNDFLSSAAE